MNLSIRPSLCCFHFVIYPGFFRFFVCMVDKNQAGRKAHAFLTTSPLFRKIDPE